MTVVPPAEGVVEPLGFANGVQVYPIGANVPLDVITITTFGLVQLIVNPFIVVGVIVSEGIEVLETTATVCVAQQPVMVLQKLAV